MQRGNTVHIIFGLVIIAMGLLLFLNGGIEGHDCIISIFLFCGLIFVLNHMKQTSCTIIGKLLVLLIMVGICSVFLSNADKSVGFHEFIKLFCLWGAFQLGIYIHQKGDVLKIILGLAMALASIGILSYCKLFPLSEGVFYDAGILRLQSTIKYANTTACILGCGYFSFIGIYKTQEKERNILLIMGTVILTAMFLTFSKGSIGIFLLIVMFVLNKHKSIFWAIFIHIFLCAGLAILIFLCVINHFPFVGLVALLTILPLINICQDKIKNMRISINFIPTFLLILTVILILIGGCLILILPEKFPTFYYRLIYMKDALQLLRHNLIFGNGPGSWEFLQYNVQQIGYFSKYIHNGFLQFLIEYGLLFIVIFSAICFLAIRRCMKQMKIGTGSRPTIILSMLVLLLLHAVIDFDFSFGFILAMLGMLLSQVVDVKTGLPIHIKFTKAFNLLVICFTIYISIGYGIQYQFEKAIEENDYPSAFTYAKRQFSIFPYDATAAHNIAVVGQEIGKDPVFVLEWLNCAEELSPLNPECVRNKIQFYVDNSYGNITELCRQYISMMPKNEEAYSYVQSRVEMAVEKGLCPKEEQNKFLKELEEKRADEKVIDRNKVLEDMIN